MKPISNGYKRYTILEIENFEKLPWNALIANAMAARKNEMYARMENT